MPRMDDLCSCMGPMYGEPYCHCRMTSMGLSMDNNPLRIAADKQFKEDIKKAMLPGGWLHKWNILKRESSVLAPDDV
jgi:hypothetical protein